MTAAPKLENHPALEAARDAAPEGMRAELINGSLMMSPAPRFRHQRVCAQLTMRLMALLEPQQRRSDGPPPGQEWIFVPVPELHLGPLPDKVNPDLAGWRVERRPSRDEDTAIETVPDWICEVLSPSTEAYDRGTKLPMFASHGVRHAWIVDPELRTLEVYRAERGVFRPCARFENEAVVNTEPFDNATFELDTL